MTEWENHRTETEWENSYIYKSFGFQARTARTARRPPRAARRPRAAAQPRPSPGGRR